MAKHPEQSNVDALERSLRNAPDIGRAQFSAAVALARTLARRLDDLSEMDFLIGGKLDNVTAASYLKTLEALGLVAQKSQAVVPAKSAQKVDDELAKYRARSG